MPVRISSVQGSKKDVRSGKWKVLYTPREHEAFAFTRKLTQTRRKPQHISFHNINLEKNEDDWLSFKEDLRELQIAILQKAKFFKTAYRNPAMIQ